MSAKKSALIIANSEYQDPVLRQLVAPGQDAEALAGVLQDPAVGGFEVETLLNAPSYQACETIEAFFGERERDHLLLLYFSGHGITDDDGLLYFAASNTQHKRLRSTGVGARWVNDIMIQCRSRRQVLLLDCCHSGAFARTKAGGNAGTGQQFEANTRDEGRGRVVLTASDAIQYSFEGDAVDGKGVRSVFTHALVEGLSTGEADLDGDGEISLDELYSYVHRRVKDQTPQQSPRRWDFDVEGGIVIGQNRRVVAAPLPEDLQHAIESFVPEAREAAVRRLDTLLRGRHRGLALSARNALLLLKEDDSRRVSSAAEKCIEGCTDQASEGESTAGKASAVEETEAEQGRLAQAEADKLPREVEEARQSERQEKEEQAQQAKKKADADRRAGEKAEAKSKERVQPTPGYRLVTPAPVPFRSAPGPGAPSLSDSMTAATLPATPPGTEVGGPSALVRSLGDPELEKLKSDLAIYIGPMARIIVARAAKSSSSLRQLYETMAAEIPSPADRQKFLASRAR